MGAAGRLGGRQRVAERPHFERRCRRRRVRPVEVTDLELLGLDAEPLVVDQEVVGDRQLVLRVLRQQRRVHLMTASPSAGGRSRGHDEQPEARSATTLTSTTY